MATCEACGVSFEPKKTSRAGKFCSVGCFYAVGPVGPRKATVKRPRQRKVKGHPLAPPSGVVAVSRLVLFDKLGDGPQPCHWCGTVVAWKVGAAAREPDALFVDHLDWDHFNDDPDNLVPSCNNCNARRAAPGKRSAIASGEPTLMVGGNRTRALERTCPTCGADFLTLPARPRTYCSRKCYRDSDADRPPTGDDLREILADFVERAKPAIRTFKTAEAKVDQLVRPLYVPEDLGDAD